MKTVIQIRNEVPDQDRASLHVSVFEEDGLLAAADIEYPDPTPDHPHGDWLGDLFSKIEAIERNLGYVPHTGQDPIPVYIADWTPKSQSMPWEWMSRAGEFFALKGKRPVGRMLGGTSEVGLPVQGILSPPVRILVVISAARINAVAEWNQIYSALLASEVPCSIWAIIAEPALVEVLEQIERGPTDPAFGFELLHSDGDLINRYDEMIRKRIVEFRPNILHFFCHGRVMTGKPVLELATRRDHLLDAERGTVILGQEFFEDLRGVVNNVWLVVLNCCNGAVPQNGSPLAKKVAESGFPAVIGMRAEITVETAASFSGELYRTLRSEIEGKLRRPNDRWPVEWANLLTKPRQRICMQLGGGTLDKAAKIREWTYPVLYVRRELFTLLRSDSIEELKGKLHTLVTFREEMAKAGTNTPQSVLSSLDEVIRETKVELGLTV